jgi:serine protease Do
MNTRITTSNGWGSTVKRLLERLPALSWLGLILIVASPVVGHGGEKGEELLDICDLSLASETLAMMVGPAVVQIFTTTYGPVSGDPSSGALVFGQQRSSGSGVILDPDGYIVTNAHVVEGARRLQVLLSLTSAEMSRKNSILKSRGHLVGAQIVGIDKETDLAVLKVQERDLPYLTLGDSDRLRQGQLVFAFGSPLGLENSVSLGVISSVARQLRPEDPMIWIQTDAAINPGNSGGPLVNSAGEVVGINTLIFSQSGGHEGIGFAAPSNIVRAIFDQLRTTGRIQRGVIGINAQSVTPWLAAGLELAQDWGVVIADVYPDGPAEAAGLVVGDLILALDGKTMENGRQFDVNVYRKPVGGKVELDILRGTKRHTISVQVVERPGSKYKLQNLVSPERNLVPRLGILGLDLDREIMALLPGLRESSGVVVAARSLDSPLLEGSLVPGDVIHAVNNQEVGDLEDLKRILGALKFGEPAVLQIERSGRMMFVALQID